MRTGVTSLVTAILLIVAGMVADAAAQNPPAQPLPAVIRKAKDAYRPITQADVNRRRGELLAAADRLDRYLQTGGQNGNNWKRFLRWEQMRAELARGRAQISTRSTRFTSST